MLGHFLYPFLFALFFLILMAFFAVRDVGIALRDRGGTAA